MTSEADPAAITTSRLEAFSDGITAVAATLLVFNLKTASANQTIFGAISKQGVALAGFGVSFATIGIFWVNHHHLFHQVRRIDRPLMFINLYLLAAITFLPYTTNVLGTGFTHHQGRDATLVYSGSLGVASLGFTFLWLYLWRHDYLLHPSFRSTVGGSIRRSLIGPVGYGLAAVSSLLNADLGLAIDAAVAVWFVIGPHHLRSPQPETDRSEPLDSKQI